MAAKKKVKVRAKPRTGLAGAPLNKGFDAFKHYVHMEVDKKDLTAITKPFIKAQFSKADAAAILSNPDYHFYMYSLHAAAIYWTNVELELPSKYAHAIKRIKEYYNDLIEPGKMILAEKEQVAKATANIVVLTPKQRMFQKIQDTIMTDLDELEDAWIAGDEPEFDMYQAFKQHGLTGSHTLAVLQRLEGWLLDYEDAYHKRCEQAVEGYSDIKRPAMRRRIELIQKMIADIHSVKASSKATRKTRTPKPRAADKQIARLQYLKESNDFKITSVLPITVIGAMRLFVFNVKTKELTEYVSDSAKGFEVKGTTLQNFGEASRKIKLRKPEEVLPIVQAKTVKQIDNTWQKLTTKTNSPNGRLNSDCVLLRVLDR
jgi:hypothetical protein